MTPPPGTKQLPAPAVSTAPVEPQVEVKTAVVENTEVDREHKRKRIEEVQDTVLTEADEMEEEKRKAKVAKKVKEAEEKRKKDEGIRLENEKKEREAKEAEEHQRKKEEAEALAQEKQKREAETRRKEEEARKRKAAVFEQLVSQGNKMAEDARKREEEEEIQRRKQAKEEARIERELRKEEARIEKERLEEEREIELWSQKLLDLSVVVEEPCFEVFKEGRLVETHVLAGDKKSWIIGRMEEHADMVIASDRISRKHAKVTVENSSMFLTDLGSTYGTGMDGEKLETNKSVELCDGAKFRFGGLPELYVYREPAKEPDLSSSVEEPCFQVFKDGRHLKTHALAGEKKSWIIGRLPDHADMVIPSERISRNHAQMTCEDPRMFLRDLGSAKGTTKDGKKLPAKKSVELFDGAKLRFGGLPEVYVYREPEQMQRRKEESREESAKPAEVGPKPDFKATAESGEEAPAENNEEARIKRIQAAAERKRLERKASKAQQAVSPGPVVTAKQEEEQKKKAAEDEDRIKRIQQKRQEKKKAAGEATAADAAPKTEQSEKKKTQATGTIDSKVAEASAKTAEDTGDHASEQKENTEEDACEFF